MFRSLRWRIALAYGTLVAVSILLLSAYLLSYFRGRSLVELETHLGAQAHLVMDAAQREILLAGGEPAALQPLAVRLGKETQTRITLIDGSGRVLADSEQDPARMDNHGDRPEVIQALATGLGESRRQSSTLGYGMMYVAVPLRSGSEISGVVRVSLPLTEIERSEGRLVQATALAGALTTVLAVGLATYLVRANTRPLQELTRMARRMAAGSLEQRAYVDSRDEVRELAVAFNQMAAQLKEMIESITGERNRLAAILSTMADGIVIVDREGKVSLLNPTAGQIFRTAPSEAAGRSFIDVGRDHELVQLAADCLEPKGKRADSVRLIEMGAPRRHLRAVATPVRYGRDLQALIVLQDLTEMRRLETVRRDLVANASHELRTPLASIKALVETLREGALDDPAVARDFLARVEIEVDGLTQVVKELLELSRIESGRAPMRMASVPVVDLLATAERLLPQAERAGISLEVRLDDDQPPVLADAERVQQVVVNLVHNAVKFTPPGGRVVVSARPQAEGVIISVADTGVGIASEDLPRVFERFYKADRSRTSGGTGLGLAIAKHVVQAHGGRIWAESPGEGRGSTFHFTLRVAQTS